MALNRKVIYRASSAKTIPACHASGMTLVELLVVLAIIAGLAGLVYPAIMDSIKKSEAAMAAQRIDAVEKAKVQYRLDYIAQSSAGTATDIDNKSLEISDLETYLTRFGQTIKTAADLNSGTGGTVNINTLSNPATFSPSSSDAKFIALLKQYGVNSPDSGAPAPSH
jgi:prepilin-type N-terminal cleavage/methylation domain-containing protein